MKNPMIVGAVWAVCILACTVLWGVLGRLSHPVEEKGIISADYREGFKWGFKAGQLLPTNLCSQIGDVDCYYLVPPDSGNVQGMEPEISDQYRLWPKGQDALPSWNCKQGASSFIASSTVSKVECEKISGYEGNRK